MQENPFQVFIELQNRWPVLGQAYFYAAAVPVIILLVFFGRFWLRGMVNRRVKSIGIDGGAFLSLDQMRKQGLINEDEYKGMRRKLAERQMKEMTAQPAPGRSAQDVLMAIQANPDLAKTMLQPADALVRRSLEGLGKKHADDEAWEPAPGVVLGAYPGTEAAIEAKMAAGAGAGQNVSRGAGAVLAPTPTSSAPSIPSAAPAAARPRTAPLPIEAWDSFNPGDPLSDPRLIARAESAAPEPAPQTAPGPSPAPRPTAARMPTPPATPPSPPIQRSPIPVAQPAPPEFGLPPRKKSGGAPMDIDALLEKGLITREEYDRLAGLMNQI